MSEEKREAREDLGADGGEREIRQLLREAGARPQVPAADLATIRAAARAEWEAQTVRATRPRGLFVQLAAAAGLIAALAAGWLWWGGGGSVPVATVALVRGEAEAAGRFPWQRHPLTQGAELADGVELSTGGAEGEVPGRLALRLAGDRSLRLDTDTRVRLLSSSTVELMAGAVYVDSGETPDDSGVLIATEFGTVREIGTQFEVRLRDDPAAPLAVRVREGRVSLDRDGARHTAKAGVSLTVYGDGSVARDRPAAESWEWAIAAAPSFPIEGAALESFLRWLRRETGWSVVYDDEELSNEITAIKLHGSIGGLTPTEAATAVLPGTGLVHRIEGDVLYLARTGAKDSASLSIQ